MSVFDHSFREPSSCFGLCNEWQARVNNSGSDLQHRLPVDDDLLMTSEDRETKREIDDLLSEAMTRLTFEERQKEEEILHGVDQKVAEEETFIETSLQQLESYLATIKNRSVYEIAERMHPVYVRRRAFRIMFLRGNRYNVKESAENMLRFFETKRELFGLKKLVKDITIEDLDEDDIEALKAGFLQITGRKDRSGRIIHLNVPGLRSDMPLQSELRARFYTLMSAMETEESQISSIVVIVYSVGTMRDRFGGSGLFENAKVASAIPKDTAGMHVCSNEVGEYLVNVAILKGIPHTRLRSRSRIHYGSHTECMYHMSTYGIPQDVIPLDPNTGQVNLKPHLAWVESRFAKEKQDHPLPGITPVEQSTTNPGDNDVLVGTGKQSNNIGNQRVRAQVKELSQAYEGGDREARRGYVDSVINAVQESGGLFLKEHNVDGWNVVWKEMSKDQVRKNIRQAFRNSYRRR